MVGLHLRLGSENRCSGTSMMGIGSSNAELAELARKRDNCASYLHDISKKLVTKGFRTFHQVHKKLTRVAIQEKP